MPRDAGDAGDCRAPSGACHTRGRRPRPAGCFPESERGSSRRHACPARCAASPRSELTLESEAEGSAPRRFEQAAEVVDESGIAGIAETAQGGHEAAPKMLDTV